MSLAYSLLYGVGYTPWEEIAELPRVNQQFSAAARARGARPPAAVRRRARPRLRQRHLERRSSPSRGWQVTGVDTVSKALRRARQRRPAPPTSTSAWSSADVTRPRHPRRLRLRAVARLRALPRRAQRRPAGSDGARSHRRRRARRHPADDGLGSRPRRRRCRAAPAAPTSKPPTRPGRSSTSNPSTSPPRRFTNASSTPTRASTASRRPPSPPEGSPAHRAPHPAGEPAVPPLDTRSAPAPRSPT